MPIIKEHSGQSPVCQNGMDSPDLQAAREGLVGRTYAGILGPLALLTTLAHGAVHARPAESILLAAGTSLWLFAALGYLAGWIAGRTVDEAVRARITRETAAGEHQAPTTKQRRHEP